MESTAEVQGHPGVFSENDTEREVAEAVHSDAAPIQ
jgi:hypothetical protein